LKNLKLLSRVGPGIRHHHEHWDGTGYPDGLAGENIPLMARLLAVADACEALMSDRVFRQALPATRINAIFSAGAGAIWDPRLVHCFLECSQEFYTLYAQGLNETVVLAQEQTLGGGQNSPQFLSEDQSPDPGRAIPSPAVQS
jgi:HD-GYP domain-containing protein (c-di-GMP phosphodiesterase class II)